MPQGHGTALVNLLLGLLLLLVGSFLSLFGLALVFTFLILALSLSRAFAFVLASVGPEGHSLLLLHGGIPACDWEAMVAVAVVVRRCCASAVLALARASPFALILAFVTLRRPSELGFHALVRGHRTRGRLVASTAAAARPRARQPRQAAGRHNKHGSAGPGAAGRYK